MSINKFNFLCLQVSFFAYFVSTFALPPLLSIIWANLDLMATDIGNAMISSVSNAVFDRITIGTACDLLTPDLALPHSLSSRRPPLTALSLPTPLSRSSRPLVHRFSLATIVSTQFRMSSMFSTQFHKGYWPTSLDCYEFLDNWQTYNLFCQSFSSFSPKTMRSPCKSPRVSFKETFSIENRLIFAMCSLQRVKRSCPVELLPEL